MATPHPAWTRHRRYAPTLLNRAPLGLVALVLLGMLLPLTNAPLAAAAGTCSASMFTWTGSVGTSWTTPGNWDQGCVPGQRGDTPYDDEVIIPAGAFVVLPSGYSADLAHLTNRGSLKVALGGWLLLHGDSTSASLTLDGAGLGGEGALTVSTTLVWTSEPGGAATQTTRRCGLGFDCSNPSPARPTQAGRTIIAAGATMKVNGRGVNLHDSRVIENHGTVTESANGFIAASYGTSFLNVRDAASVGQYVLASDVGFYQGFTTPGLPIATFVNTGRILKSGGTGTSIIDAAYSRRAAGNPYTGTVVVKTGSVSIVSSGSDAVTATVSQGAELATGSCPDSGAAGTTVPCTTAVATAANPQVTSVALTKAGTTSSAVTIQKTTEGNPGGLGSPVRIETPGAQSSAAAPLVFTLRLDGTVLGGGDPAYEAKHRAVQRRPDGGVYDALPDCATSPLGPSTVACVDRTASGADGNDLVMVIDSLANSRYRIGAGFS